MRRIAIAFLLIAAPAAAQVPQTPSAQNVPSTYQLRVAGPTYFTNGETKGDALVVPFGKFGETILVDVTSGPTLCDLKTPVKAAPPPAGDAPKLDPAAKDAVAAQYALMAKRRAFMRPGDGSGWRLAVTPVREENGALVLEVAWPQAFGFSKGYWLSMPAQTSGQTLRYRATGATLTLTLKPGARVLLDRLAVPMASSGACAAIGMGLEIGVDSSRSTVVESEVWLVHRKPDGSETSEKQVLRTTTAGAPSAYVFPKAMFGHDVFGQVSPAKSDGTMDVQLSIGGAGDGSMREAILEGRGPITVSSREALVTMTRVSIRSDNPAEVVSVPLVTVRVDDVKGAAKGNHEFSLRIRSKQLATSR